VQIGKIIWLIKQLQSWRNKGTIGLYSVNILKCPLIGLQRKFSQSRGDGHML